MWYGGNLRALFSKVFPAVGLKFTGGPVLILHNDLMSAYDLPDLGDWYSSNSLRDALAGSGREQEFVIFATVEGEIEIDFTRGLPNA